MNMAFVKPELGLSKTFGLVVLELVGAVAFYSDNDDFQGHVVYRFRNGVWASVGTTY